MIITRTPFRISFFGGGTDYPAFYNEHGGAVLSTTINKYCYITCRYLPPFFDHKYRIRYTHTEHTQTLDEIKHPSVRECLRFVGIKDGIEMIHTNDVPAMSGIGSSSSFTVGLLNALYALKGKMVTRRQLAYDAIHVEQSMIGEHVGSQDQVSAAFGGFNKIEFGGKDGLFVQPATISSEKLQQFQDSLLFYFTGFSRVGPDVAKEQIKKTQSLTRELNEIRNMVDHAITILNSDTDNLNELGKLLHEAWQIKHGLTPLISTPEIDNIYDVALRAGALGGKLCGAGGGGFILLFVPPEKRNKVKHALKKLLEVPFRFESLGSHIIFYTN